MKGWAILGHGRLIGKCQTGQQEQDAYDEARKSEPISVQELFFLHRYLLRFH